MASPIRGSLRVPKIRGPRRVCGLSRCSCFGGYGGTEAPPPPPPLPPPSRFGHHHQQQRPHEQRGTERWWTPGATRTVHEGKLDVRRGKSIERTPLAASDQRYSSKTERDDGRLAEHARAQERERERQTAGEGEGSKWIHWRRMVGRISWRKQNGGRS